MAEVGFGDVQEEPKAVDPETWTGESIQLEEPCGEEGTKVAELEITQVETETHCVATQTDSYIEESCVDEEAIEAKSEGEPGSLNLSTRIEEVVHEEDTHDSVESKLKGTQVRQESDDLAWMGDDVHTKMQDMTDYEELAAVRREVEELLQTSWTKEQEAVAECPTEEEEVWVTKEVIYVSTTEDELEADQVEERSGRGYALVEEGTLGEGLHEGDTEVSYEHMAGRSHTGRGKIVLSWLWATVLWVVLVGCETMSRGGTMVAKLVGAVSDRMTNLWMVVLWATMMGHWIRIAEQKEATCNRRPKRAKNRGKRWKPNIRRKVRRKHLRLVKSKCKEEGVRKRPIVREGDWEAHRRMIHWGELDRWIELWDKGGPCDSPPLRVT